MKNIRDTTENWLSALGYDGSLGVLHRSGGGVRADHPYAREIELMLQDDDIGASAVYEVDHVPVVCFVPATGNQPLSSEFIEEVRRKIWNQNLVSIVMIVDGEEAIPYPSARTCSPSPKLVLESAHKNGIFSASEVCFGDVQARLPDWFDPKHRVDHILLENLDAAVGRLDDRYDLQMEQAQLLVGKCIFVSYLEHRGIVGDPYREKRKVGNLLDLLGHRDGKGLQKLFRQLKSDFNGDLLEIEGGANVDWHHLDEGVLDVLEDFLRQTRLRSGQKSFWAYDFKHIPVELVSGIYESFLGSTQRADGAVYTPRHLAMLAVDEALRGVDFPWKKRVLDGACGSGILLTTAYRRMLGLAAQEKKRPLAYKERRDILMSGIRGGDISRAACKVTAFSLYLALLEDLAPNDVTQLQDDEQVKLPELLDRTIYSGERGDFFAENNPISCKGSADIVISNPPWFQPSEEDSHSYEEWWRQRFGQNLPRRQVALAFARRATDALVPGGRMCLILPASVLAASGIHVYLEDWFRELQPERIFNLSDMRFVLFPGAIHPTALVTGLRRSQKDSGRIPPAETCEYLVPKADISLAFGRLTTHSIDRKQLHLQSLCEDPELLRTYFWGTQFDETLVAKLSLLGTLDDLSKGDDARFVFCKGFRETDKSRALISTESLRQYKFLPTGTSLNNHYPKKHLFVAPERLIDFPKELTHLPRLGSKDNQAFQNARVLFPDGAAHDTLEIRACFTDVPFCFSDTIGAIVDLESDSTLMLFVAAYLRSSLASYLLFYTAFSVVMERPHVKVAEIRRLPFVLPSQHEDPALATKILKQVVALLEPFSLDFEVADDPAWMRVRKEINELMFVYFGLSEVECSVVRDTCTYLIPSRQPGSIKSIGTSTDSRVNSNDYQEYAVTLQKELVNWRDRLKGDGYFDVQVFCSPDSLSGSMSIIEMTVIGQETNAPTVHNGREQIKSLLNQLRGADRYPLSGGGVYSTASDFLVQFGSYYYLVKPNIKRLWLAPAAVNDAYRIVQSVRALSGAN